MVDRQTLQDPEHALIYGAVLDLREDFIDLKQYVNHEQGAIRRALELKADKQDINLWLLWRQSPVWMKFIGAAVTAAVAITAAVARVLPLPPF